jgi:hypothetical protein
MQNYFPSQNNTNVNLNPINPNIFISANYINEMNASSMKRLGAGMRRSSLENIRENTPYKHTFNDTASRESQFQQSSFYSSNIQIPTFKPRSFDANNSDSSSLFQSALTSSPDMNNNDNNVCLSSSFLMSKVLEQKQQEAKLLNMNKQLQLDSNFSLTSHQSSNRLVNNITLPGLSQRRRSIHFGKSSSLLEPVQESITPSPSDAYRVG